MNEETKITTPHSLNNEYRDELEKGKQEIERDPYAGIPERVLVTRDQAVLLKELKFNSFICEINIKNVDIAIDAAEALKVELLAFPKSLYREVAIQGLGKIIENNLSLRNANKFRIDREITLLALEELFAEDNKEPEEPSDLATKFVADVAKIAEDNDDLTIPDDQPGDGVDEEDSPEEAI